MSLKIEREPARTTERHFVDKHMTYAASRDGAEPLWEFWPDQGHNFLQVQRLVRIRVVFDRKKLPYGFCKGVVRTECKRYVRYADTNGKLLDRARTQRWWVLWTGTPEEFSTADLRASFDASAQPLPQE